MDLEWTSSATWSVTSFQPSPFSTGQNVIKFGSRAVETNVLARRDVDILGLAAVSSLSRLVVDASTMIVVPVARPWHRLCRRVIQGYGHPGCLPVLRCRAVKGGCMGVVRTSLVPSHSTSPSRTLPSY